MMNITIPKPCEENWNSMLPSENGRFCLNCQKTVVDFSSKTKAEIKAFFNQATGKICGRFKSTQLTEKKNHKLPKKRCQLFLLALYGVFGSFLFTSCSEAPSKKHLTGKVKIEHTEQDSIINTAIKDSIPAKNECTKKVTKKNPSSTLSPTDTSVFVPLHNDYILGEVPIDLD
jgi:hypothetical protein